MAYCVLVEQCCIFIGVYNVYFCKFYQGFCLVFWYFWERVGILVVDVNIVVYSFVVGGVVVFVGVYGMFSDVFQVFFVEYNYFWWEGEDGYLVELVVFLEFLVFRRCSVQFNE